MSKKLVADKMQNLQTSVFSLIDDLYKKEIAKGKDVVNLSIGNPDLNPPDFVKELILKAIQENNFGYAMSKGQPQLLKAFASWYKKNFKVDIDEVEEAHSLIGSQDGLAHIALAVVNPGDIVLVTDPGYPIFSAGPLMAGAELYKMPLLPENNYLPDLQAIPENIFKKAKMMILNYPNNPLATVAPKEFFEDVVKYAKKHQFLVCHDFAYGELLFDGREALSFLSIEGAKDVGVEFTTLSKNYCLAGCRIGFIAGNKEIVSALGKIKSNFDYGIFLPVQTAATEALKSDGSHPKFVANTYQKRRDVLVEGLRKIGWDMPMPPASMYAWAKVPYVKGKLMDDFTFASMLVCEAGVAVTPGSGFGENGRGYVRMALVQNEERILEAVQRIAKILK